MNNPGRIPVHILARTRDLLVCVVVLLFAVSARGQSVRERLSFDADWRFQKGEPSEATAALAYAKIKPWVIATGAEFATFPVAAPKEGEAPGVGVALTQRTFDDGAWRKLNLPHDWAIEGPFAQELPGETGKLPWAGTAWYRKHFTVDAADAGKRISLDVDGAMAYATVWLNGKFVGGWPYGYASWRVDLTPFVEVGAENVIAIRIDNPPDSSRWYPGAGIYRHVWLVKTAPVSVAQWGVFVTTPQISSASATVDVQVTIDNRSGAPAAVKVGTEIFEASNTGARVGSALASAAPVTFAAARGEIPNGRAATTSLTQRLANPKLWSLKKPQRYVAVTTVTQGDKVIDVVETPFGIRTTTFTADNGFSLNGERVPLNGVCDHHDLGALGSAINTRALERQIEILQAMGCNAIRTSHNMPAPELLELCDRMGMLVMDEAFDCWALRKKPNDYNLLFPDWHEKDLRAFVRRDRNHPCVILWSPGNEVREQGEVEGWKVASRLSTIMREEDPTRLTTGGFNNIGSGYNGFQKTVGAFGYNYKPEEYGKFHERNPTIPIYSSESASCISSRGEYFFPVSEDKADGRADFQMSSYDLYAPRWAWPPDVEFTGLDKFPYTAGEFVWTGFDYLGEPTPYNADSTNLLNYSNPADKERAAKELAEIGKIRVPSRSSYFGIIDIAGFPKDRYYIYQARWRPDFPMAHILPHWNWPDRVGQVTPVFVYSSGDEAELFLNGRSLGRQKRGALEYRFRWNDVKYEPGELKVVTWKNGKSWADAVMRTTGAATKLTLAADHAKLRADGNDLSFVTVTIADKDGLLVPRTKNLVRFSISGPAEIAAVDNGDATSFEPFQANERKAYNGLALVIVRAKPGAGGAITLRAESDGLAAAEVKLTSAP